VAQTRQRVAGITPPGASRQVSLHDADARPIAKGRLGKPVEFGGKAQVMDNDDGVMWTTTGTGEPRRRSATGQGREAGHRPDRPETHRTPPGQHAGHLPAQGTPARVCLHPGDT